MEPPHDIERNLLVGGSVVVFHVYFHGSRIVVVRVSGLDED